MALIHVGFLNGIDGFVTRAVTDSPAKAETYRADFEKRFPGLIWKTAKDSQIKKVTAEDGKESYIITKEE
jgi:hypothetical protein